MTDTMKPYSKAVFDVLNGNVTLIINGNLLTIPIYDYKIYGGDSPNYYICLGNQQEIDIPDTDCTWKTGSTLEIIIISRTTSEVTRDIVNDISNLVLKLLLNLPGSSNLASQSGFSINEVKRQSANLIFQITATDSFVTKTIQLTAIITQLN